MLNINTKEMYLICKYIFRTSFMLKINDMQMHVFKEMNENILNFSSKTKQMQVVFEMLFYHINKQSVRHHTDIMK